MTTIEKIIIAILSITAAGVLCIAAGVAVVVIPPAGSPRPAVATPTPAPTAEPLEFRGRGDKVVEFTVARGGPVLFGLAHRGDRNFIVWLLDGRGDQIELLANDRGDYDGQTVERLGPGRYLIEIRASGNWAVSVSRP